MKNESRNQVIIYDGDKGQLKIEVHFEGETVWLTQDQMAELFGKGRSTITEHVLNIFKEGELDEKVSVSGIPTNHRAWRYQGEDSRGFCETIQS